MSSFNAISQRKRQIGANNPIWLGVVSPVPKGGVLAESFRLAGIFIPAGSPVCLKNGVLTPFCPWQVVSVDSSTHAITIKANEIYPILPKADDFLTPVGATFDATGAAGKVSSIVAGATEGQYVVTMTDAKLDAVTANSYIALSEATAVATSGKAIANQPNGYLYNDICLDPKANGETIDYLNATGAVVDFHGEGVLIDRTYGAEFKAQMKAAVPNVKQVED